MPGVVPGIHVFADADGGSTGTRMAGRASHDDNGENRTKAMKLSDIADNPGSRKKRMRIGRGIGSGKGKTGGRGGKGQTARSGVRIKGFEGGQMPLHRRLPKRGFNNIFALDLVEINLDRVQQAIDAGKLDISGVVNGEALVKSGALRRERDGVRLLGRGEIKSKVTFEVHGASKSAIEAVEKAGGSVKILAPKKDDAAA
jgi:large subunit ribosomal protein L15